MLDIREGLDRVTEEKLAKEKRLLNSISKSLYENVLSNFKFDNSREIIEDGKEHVMIGKSPAHPGRPYDIGYTNLFIQKSDEGFYECELLNERQNISFHFYIDSGMGLLENVKEIEENLEEWCLAHQNDDKYINIIEKVKDVIPVNDFKLEELLEKVEN